MESNKEIPVPPLTTNGPYFIGTEKTGNMNKHFSTKQQ